MAPGSVSPVVAAMTPVQRSRLLRGQGSLLPSPLAHTDLTPRSAAPAEDGMAELRRKYPQEAGRPANEDGRFGVVYHARSRPGGVEVAIKRQPVAQGAQEDCVAYRELRILQHLNSRIADQRNFVFVLDWNKCWVEDEQHAGQEQRTDDQGDEEQHEEEVLESSRGHRDQRSRRGVAGRAQKESNGSARESGSKGGSGRGEQERENGALCMNLVLEAAGTSLRELVRRGDLGLDVTAFRELLFQLLYALHQAQEECQFVHNDLHLGNVLLKRRPGAPRMLYRATAGAATGWLVDGSRLAKIVDFGHSRISLPGGGAIANSRDPLRQGFLPGTDVAKLSLELKRLSLVSYVDSALAHAPEEVRKENERQNRAHKRQMMRRMTEACAPGLLLRLPFFDCLHEGAPCAGVPPAEAALYPYAAAEEEAAAPALPSALTPLHGRSRRRGGAQEGKTAEKENTRGSEEESGRKERLQAPRKSSRHTNSKRDEQETRPMPRATSDVLSETKGLRRSRRQAALQRSKSGAAAELDEVAGSMAALAM